MSKQQNSTFKCRVCGSDNLKKGKYPDIHFNSKVFTYYACRSCRSYNVFPDPDEDDFKQIYGEEDHTYLKDTPGKLEYDSNYPFAHYHGYQIKYLKELKGQLPGRSLLDFACGSGFYLEYAQRLGANVVGIEFDEEFVKTLNEKTNFDIHTLDNAKASFRDKPFDFIHLGHVLEHLPDPSAILNDLKDLAHKDTIFIVDGPLEKNRCLSRILVDLGSRIKGKPYNTFAPQHLTLTTKRSQLAFFEQNGLDKNAYYIDEQYFPLSSVFGKSFSGSLQYLAATLSIRISSLIPGSGNLFHYRGKLK